MAYDFLCDVHSQRVAVREYLKILQMAAHDSQDAVQEALRVAIAANETISSESVRVAIERHQQAPPVTDINIELPDLTEFDTLLQHFDTEVNNHESVINTARKKRPAHIEVPACQGNNPFGKKIALDIRQ